MQRLAVVLATILALVAAARPAAAHAAPHSVVLLDLRAHDVGAELRLPVPELMAALGHAPAPAEARALVANDLHALSPDGAAWTTEVEWCTAAVDAEVPVLVVSATLVPPSGHAPQVFRLVDDVIGRQVVNHDAWIGVRSDFAHGQISGEPSFVGVTGYLHHIVEVDRAGGGAGQGFRAMFRLGMQHIARGTDHLLFLLTLLLPAPLLVAGRRWGETADTRSSLVVLLRIVTAFTVGHSLTLLIGSLGWLRLPGPPVETLIAVSILVSAVHALRPVFPGREAIVAAGFGLVHGMAFAGALSELHLDAPRLALALLGFNLGVEVMQLVVVAASYPWLLLLARTPAHPMLRVGLAICAGIAALGWIGERMLGLASPVRGAVEAVAAHPLALLAGLAGLALSMRAQASWHILRRRHSSASAR